MLFAVHIVRSEQSKHSNIDCSDIWWLLVLIFIFKVDSDGNRICPLNGCADMLAAPMAWLIPLIVIFNIFQIVMYVKGLWCSLQLNFYYWKEYNIRLQKKKDNKECGGKPNWKLRWEIEKEMAAESYNYYFRYDVYESEIIHTITLDGSDPDGVVTEEKMVTEMVTHTAFHMDPHGVPDETDKML